MHALDIERKHAHLPRSARHDIYPGNARYQVEGIGSQRLLVLADRLAADPFDKIAGDTKTDRAGNIRGAGLETVRRVLEVGVVDLDVENRAAAGLPWRHRVEQVVARPQHADPGRAVGLVAREGI